MYISDKNVMPRRDRHRSPRIVCKNIYMYPDSQVCRQQILPSACYIVLPKTKKATNFVQKLLLPIKLADGWRSDNRLVAEIEEDLQLLVI